MIKELSILNYQSHKNSSLTFHKGCNVIVGGSDAGKTAILRALRWCIWNRPSGSSFRSNWAKEEDTTMVSLVTDEGTITRQKHKGKEDIYSLHVNDKVGLIFKAFATNVPKEIQEALNISEINVSSQLDPPFLLSNTSGEVAQHFNKVAHLEQIDIANSNINSAIRTLEQEMKFKTAETERQEEQLKTFDYLDKMEADVEVLEELDKGYLLLIQKEAKLERIIVKIKENKAELKEHEPLLLLEEQVNVVLKYQKDKIDKSIKRNGFAKLLNNIKSNELQISRQNELLKLEPDVTAILDNMKKQDELEMKLGDLASDVEELLSIDNRVFAAGNLIEVLEEEFKREMGSECILCGQTIKHGTNKDK